jgi:predicted DNA-binding transcriptional regulator YafY
VRADRLLSILLLLQSEGHLSAGRLAATLEVSKRTIYRDVDALSSAGVPVYADRGRRGGIRLVEGYESGITGLTTPEIQALLAIDVDEVAGELGLTSSVAGVRRKLLASVPNTRRDTVRRHEGRVHVDPSGWFSIPGSRQSGLLARAIFADRRIAIRYVGRDEHVVRRNVEPLGLVLKAGEWYLVALGGPAGGRPRTYRVSRMSQIDLLGERFERPDDFDLARFWRDSTRDFERTFSTFPVRLKVRRGATAWLRQLVGEWVVEALRSARLGEHDARELTVEFESADQARVYLLGAADWVEVVEPESVRQALASAAERAQRVYAGAERRQS